MISKKNNRLIHFSFEINVNFFLKEILQNCKTAKKNEKIYHIKHVNVKQIGLCVTYFL